MSVISARFILAAFAVCVCLGSPAFAQTTQPREGDQKQEPPAPPDSPVPLENARREYEALFGGAGSKPTRGSWLDFSGSVLEVYDRDEVDEGEPELGGLYTNFAADLEYGRYGSRARFAASGGANLRYYSQISQFLAADYHGGAGLEAEVAQRTTVRVTEAVSLAPVALPYLFADPLPPDLGDPLPGRNYAVSDDKFVMAATTASIEHLFTVRSQLLAVASHRYNHYLAEATPNADWSMLDSGVLYRYRFTVDRSMRAGYNYRRASFAWPVAPDGRRPQPDENNFFAGVAIERAFSNEQRTMLIADGGFSVFGATADQIRAGNRLRLVFEASVAHQIGKTWLLLGSFDRGSQFDQGYGGPVFGNAWFASATGFLTARTDVTAWAAYTDGESLLTVAGRSFTTTTAGARVRYALSRRWALTAEYFRYDYDFTTAPDFPFLTGVPARFGRNSFRGGVQVFYPLRPR